MTVEGADSLRLPDVEVPGDISSAAPFLVAAAIVPGSAVTVHGVGTQPSPRGAARRARAHGRARRDLQPALDRRRAGRRRRGSRIRPRRDDGHGGGGPVADRRAADLRGRGVSRPRGDRRARRGGASREGVQPDRGGRRGAPEGRRPHPRDATTDSGSRAFRRGSEAASSTRRGDHRLAMLGAVVGVASREGVELRGAEAAVDELPRLLRRAGAGRSGRRSLPSRDMIVAIDGPAGSGKSTVAVDARAGGSDFATSTRARCTGR